MAPTVQAYGLDYSARELSPSEIDAFNAANPNTPISFLLRYIGYPTNPKCISHYPGALRAHEDAGRPVYLVHQVAYQDFAPGRSAGIQHARIAVRDAERAGWKGDRPIFAAFDRWLTSSDPAKGIFPIALDTVREYVAGFRSELGELAGLYGFWDVMRPCVAEDWVRWRWQCGAEDALVDGVQIYQSNRGYVYPGRPPLQSDINKSYVDIGGGGVSAEDVTTGLFNTRVDNRNLFDWFKQLRIEQGLQTDRLLDAVLSRADVDEQAIIDGLVTRLPKQLQRFSDEELDRIATAAADEQDERARKRLEDGQS